MKNIFQNKTSQEVSKILIQAQLKTDGAVKDNQSNHVQAAAAMMVSKKETPLQYLITLLKAYDDPASNKLTTETYNNFVKGFRTRLQKTQGMTFRAVRRELLEKDEKGKSTGKGLGHHLVVDKVELSEWKPKEIEPRTPKAPPKAEQSGQDEQAETKETSITMEQALTFIESIQSQSELVRLNNKIKTCQQSLRDTEEIKKLIAA